MPVPVLAISSALGVVGKIGKGVVKVGSKVVGFFKKLFGGKKRRRRQRAADKQTRLENSANEILANKLAKLEEQRLLGQAQAGVKLARIQKQLARQGISFDPTALDGTLSDLKFDIPELFERRRAPQQFQQIEAIAELPGIMQAGVTAPVLGGGFNLQTFFKNPMNILIAVGVFLLLFGRRLFK